MGFGPHASFGAFGFGDEWEFIFCFLIGERIVVSFRNAWDEREKDGVIDEDKEATKDI